MTFNYNVLFHPPMQHYHKVISGTECIAIIFRCFTHLNFNANETTISRYGSVWQLCKSCLFLAVEGAHSAIPSTTRNRDQVLLIDESFRFRDYSIPSNYFLNSTNAIRNLSIEVIRLFTESVVISRFANVCLYCLLIKNVSPLYWPFDPNNA